MLEICQHTDGGTPRWGGGPHEDLCKAFRFIASDRDRDNKVVVFTAAEDDWNGPPAVEDDWNGPPAVDEAQYRRTPDLFDIAVWTGRGLPVERFGQSSAILDVRARCPQAPESSFRLSDGRPTLEHMHEFTPDPNPTDVRSGHSPDDSSGAGPPPERPFTDIYPRHVPAVDVVRGWSSLEYLDGMRLIAAEQARLEALMATTVNGYALRRAEEDLPPGVSPTQELTPNEFAPAEIGTELAMSSQAAAGLLSNSWRLCRHLPATLNALDQGVIDAKRARSMVRLTDGLDDELQRQVEERVLARGARSSPARFTEAISRAIKYFDPEGAEARRQERLAERDVGVNLLDEGMAQLWALVPADKAQAAFATIQLLARAAGGPDDPRTMAQRRADVFADLLLGTHSGHRPVVHLDITMPLTTLAGLDNGPAMLAGYGPITAEMGRELAEHATWSRLVTDPITGALLGLDGHTYRKNPDGTLRRIPGPATDGTCPTCGQDRRATGGPTPASPTPASPASAGPKPGGPAPGGPESGGPTPGSSKAGGPGSGGARSGPGRRRDDGGRYRPTPALARHIRARNVRCVFPGCGRQARACDLDHTVPYDRGGQTTHCNIARSAVCIIV